MGNGINDTLVECSKPSLIAIINCTNAVIKNITIGSWCGNLVKTYFDIVRYMWNFTTRYLNPTDHNVP